MTQRPPGYELRPDLPSSPFCPICPSCARLSQSGWNHHSLRSSLPLSAFGSRFGSGEFPSLQSLMNSAATVSKIASQNNEESAACLLKIELTFSHARYKVILETGCLRRRNIVPLEHGTEKYVKFPSFLSIPNYNDSIKYCVQARYWNAKRVLACIQPSPC